MNKNDDFIYGIYDTRDNDRLVSVFDNGREVALFFKTTKKCIYSAVSKKQLRENRYKIERINLK